ncbi:MAG: hypothetical protein GF307_07040 [candidate division Zixibacteria bacterium]|nr:hypothetical protein [candidate division Zixibacteria bacterium]
MMDKMMGVMLGGMSKEDKDAMMDKMMDKMMGTMSKEEKQEMMLKMMPKMMEQINMLEIMPKMMLTMMPKMFDEVKAIMAEHGKEVDMMEIMPRIMGPFMSTMLREMPAEKMVDRKENMMSKMFEREDLKVAIPERQQQMMPGCMKRLMENIPYDEKLSYATHILGILATHGSKGISDEQKANYKAKLLEVINTEL